jgi:DNA-binding beta-propeller fold protein YncE
MVRKIIPSHLVSPTWGVPTEVITLAGTGAQGSTDGAAATASFAYPYGVTADSAGNVYVADSGNSTVRLITTAGTVSTPVGVAGSSGFVAGLLPGVLTGPVGLAFSGTSLYIVTGNAVAVASNL